MDTPSAEVVNGGASTLLRAGDFSCTSSDTCFINCLEDDGRQCPGERKLTDGDCDVCSSPREKGAKPKQKYGHYKKDFRHV